MKTTKKVASLVKVKKSGEPLRTKTEVKKKTQVPKKSVSKLGATNKLQKDIKKNKSTKISKAVTKKTVENKTLQSKTIQSKIESKFAKLEAFQRKEVINEVQERKPLFVAIKNQALSIRPTISLALLSPYKFPVDTHELIAKSARATGLIFAIVGAITTLFFANGVFSNQLQIASTISATSATTLTTSKSGPSSQTDCTDPLNYLAPSCASLVDQTPDVAFILPNSNSPFSGSERIQVKVKFATRVKLSVLQKSTNTEIQLGSMSNVSSDTWEYNWNTQLQNDGEYMFKALVENGYGPYQQQDLVFIQVVNYPLPEITNSTQNSSTGHLNNNTGSSSIAVVNKTSDVSLGVFTVDVLESKDEFKFEINIQDVDGVKLYALHVPTQKNIFLGNAYKANDDLWRYRWVATSFEVGDYKITAQPLTTSTAISPLYLDVKKISITSGTTVSASTTPQTPTTKTLQPPIDIAIHANQPLVGSVDLKIDVQSAAAVELYLQQKNALTRTYLGKPTSVDTDTWLYHFNTNLIPNGEYVIIAVATNTYGQYEQKTPITKIANPIASVLTTEETEDIKDLNEVYEIVEKSTAVDDVVSKTVQTPEEDTQIVPEIQVLEDETIADDLIVKNQGAIDKAFEQFLLALRLDDKAAIETAEDEIAVVRKNVINQIEPSAPKTEVEKYIQNYFESRIKEIEASVVATERLIVERTNKEASLDSDGDGITNYDEVTLYKTNPYNPDTDGDGYIDSAEVLSGHNPTDDTNETLITFESPKEKGIVREDILQVTGIATAASEPVTDQTSNPNPPSAIITGVALPNSFVTLYIFSTPIVVTLKTESDGSWSYHFDKELEDGVHEVYVGMTDNAGKIVAKSNVFSFVKEAQAFSPSQQTASPEVAVVEIPTKTFLGEYMLYLILSVSVVAIGLVLILLGIHLELKNKKEILFREEGDLSTVV